MPEAADTTVKFIEKAPKGTGFRRIARSVKLTKRGAETLTKLFKGSKTFEIAE